VKTDLWQLTTAFDADTLDPHPFANSAKGWAIRSM
jgi:hypothetical protein